METKYVRVPFDLELAKKITNGECDGRIVTRDGRNARIVCWDKKSDSIYSIVALLDVNTGELIFTYTVNGFEVVDRESENDLMLEIPEYMTFNDGDVIAYNNIKDVFFIIGSKCNMTDENPHYYVKYEKGYITFGTEDSFCRLKGSRLATEEEKQTMLGALKNNISEKAKKCLNLFFPNHSNSSNIGKDFKFKPKDWILCKGSYSDIWTLCQFSHIDETSNSKYVSVGGNYWDECIPYNEQTAHLLGTTENTNDYGK